MVCVAGVDGMEGMGRVSGMGGGSGVDKKITIPPCPCLSRQGCFQSCRALGPYQLAHLRDFLLMLGEQIRQREKRGRWEGERKRVGIPSSTPRLARLLCKSFVRAIEMNLWSTPPVTSSSLKKILLQ